jgi:hypothetical protein
MRPVLQCHLLRAAGQHGTAPCVLDAVEWKVTYEGSGKVVQWCDQNGHWLYRLFVLWYQSSHPESTCVRLHVLGCPHAKSAC